MKNTRLAVAFALAAFTLLPFALWAQSVEKGRVGRT